MTKSDAYCRLCAVVDALLARLPSPMHASRTVMTEARHLIIQQAWQDLLAVAARDAAANGDPGYVLGSYASFRAVLTYRVAHQLLKLPGNADSFRAIARRLSEHAKASTGVEIHPAAMIGIRFVIDHGLGTVIGEQTEIGDDCYILQGAILGGTSIGHSRTHHGSRRHPRIGNRVEIGGGAMVLGPVRIGDDCQLGPGVRITFDVPDKALVRVVSATQVTLTLRPVEVHAMAAISNGLLVTGTGLTGLTPALLGEDRVVIAFLPVERAGDTFIRCGWLPARIADVKFVGLFDSTRLACFVSASRILPKT